MRFLAGVLLGLLLSGPAVHHHEYTYEITERNVFNVTSREEAVMPPGTPVPLADGYEQCVIDILDRTVDDWNVHNVIAVLEVGWTVYDDPCDMLERLGEE